MANSPVDKSKQFVESGMTLITDQAADYWLQKASKVKEEKKLIQVQWLQVFGLCQQKIHYLVVQQPYQEMKVY